MGKMRAFNTKSMKISGQQVREMYQRLKNGELTQGQAARLYGLGVIQVGRIARGESRAAETGANEDPVPNFNFQVQPGEAEASLARVKEKLNEVGKAPSLYESRPPTEDEDNAVAARAMPKLEDESRIRENSLEARVDQGLDDLTKGD